VLEGVTLKLDGLADPEEHSHVDPEPTCGAGCVPCDRQTEEPSRPMPTARRLLETRTVLASAGTSLRAAS